ncbi:early growth response protein 1-like protein [Aphelenchoides avenae]|nr:early growth response protein 1-like protein [Aphelenchus avenae]
MGHDEGREMSSAADVQLHSCSVAGCGASFKRTGELIRHSRTHSGDRPFQCNYCDSRFSRRYHLKTHLRGHTGDNFTCNECGVSFSRRDRLRQHCRKEGHDREASSSNASSFSSATSVAEGDTIQCAVCGGTPAAGHYGTLACHGCASFFRRTIAESQSYQCTCRMPYLRMKKGCRHCRFRLCIDVGMRVSDVKCSKVVLRSDYDTLLSTVLLCRNRLYVTRGAYLRDSMRMRVDDSPYRAVPLAEYRVLEVFWNDCLPKAGCFGPGVSPAVMTDHFYAIWFLLELLLATVRHGRLETELCYMDHATTVRSNSDWLTEFHRQDEHIKDPNGLAVHTSKTCAQALQLARRIKKASFDDHEVTAILLLLIAYYEKDVFADEQRYNWFVKQVLRELHDHYASTYWSYAERLATLTDILGEFHVTSGEQLYLTNDRKAAIL